MFRYITDCKELGCTQLDPWMRHMQGVRTAEEIKGTYKDPDSVGLSASDRAYVAKVRAASEKAGVPFGCIAADEAHIYEETADARTANRAWACFWLLIAEELGAPQIRVDAGGPPDLSDEVLGIIVEGYEDVIARAKAKGIDVLMENHWGPANDPGNVVRILDAVPGLGLLFDTGNWRPGMQEKGWEECAPRAVASHIKTFAFDERGNERSADVPKAIRLLVDAGYDGCWGIESCPEDGDEYGAARKTIELIRRTLKDLGVEK